MSGSFNDLVDDWIQWFNDTLAHPGLPLHASRSPNDAGNELDPTITKAAIHILSPTARSVPAMIGLITNSALDNDDKDILGQELFEEQIRPLRSDAPFFCFVAHSASHLTFYCCEDGSAGRDARSKELGIVPVPAPSYGRDGTEQDRVLREVFISDIKANLAQVGRATMSSFE